MASFLFGVSSSAILSVAILLFFNPLPTLCGDYILDIHGAQVLNSVDYFIVPQLYGTGGLTVSPRNTSNCPDYVMKQQVYSAGSPFSMAPVSTYTQSLSTGLPLAFYFTHTTQTTTSCNNLQRWSVNPNYQSYVIISDDQAVQFNSTYYFTVQLTNDSKYGYNIQFCYNGNCNGLGFVNGVFGVKPSDPFPFVFVQSQ